MKIKVADAKLALVLFVVIMCGISLMIGLNSSVKGLDADTNYSVVSEKGIISSGSSSVVNWQSAGSVEESEVHWSVSDANILSLDVMSGSTSAIVTGLKEGSSVVTCEYRGRLVGSVTIFVVNNSLDSDCLSMVTGEEVSVRLKDYLKTSVWCKYGDVSWSVDADGIIDIKSRNYGSECSISAVGSGSCVLTALFNGEVVGFVDIEVR